MILNYFLLRPTLTTLQRCESSDRRLRSNRERSEARRVSAASSAASSEARRVSATKRLASQLCAVDFRQLQLQVHYSYQNGLDNAQITT